MGGAGECGGEFFDGVALWASFGSTGPSTNESNTTSNSGSRSAAREEVAEELDVVDEHGRRPPRYARRVR